MTAPTTPLVTYQGWVARHAYWSRSSTTDPDTGRVQLWLPKGFVREVQTDPLRRFVARGGPLLDRRPEAEGRRAPSPGSGAGGDCMSLQDVGTLMLDGVEVTDVYLDETAWQMTDEIDHDGWQPSWDQPSPHAGLADVYLCSVERWWPKYGHVTGDYNIISSDGYRKETCWSGGRITGQVIYAGRAPHGDGPIPYGLRFFLQLCLDALPGQLVITEMPPLAYHPDNVRWRWESAYQEFQRLLDEAGLSYCRDATTQEVRIYYRGAGPVELEGEWHPLRLSEARSLRRLPPSVEVVGAPIRREALCAGWEWSLSRADGSVGPLREVAAEDGQAWPRVAKAGTQQRDLAWKHLADEGRRQVYERQAFVSLSILDPPRDLLPLSEQAGIADGQTAVLLAPRWSLDTIDAAHLQVGYRVYLPSGHRATQEDLQRTVPYPRRAFRVSWELQPASTLRADRQTGLLSLEVEADAGPLGALIPDVAMTLGREPDPGAFLGSQVEVAVDEIESLLAQEQRSILDAWLEHCQALEDTAAIGAPGPSLAAWWSERPEDEKPEPYWILAEDRAMLRVASEPYALVGAGWVRRAEEDAREAYYVWPGRSMVGQAVLAPGLVELQVGVLGRVAEPPVEVVSLSRSALASEASAVAREAMDGQSQEHASTVVLDGLVPCQLSGRVEAVRYDAGVDGSGAPLASTTIDVGVGLGGPVAVGVQRIRDRQARERLLLGSSLPVPLARGEE